MTITKLKSSEEWYRAQQHVKNPSGTTATATGFGTTRENAIADCTRQIEVIKKLSKRVQRHVK